MGVAMAMAVEAIVIMDPDIKGRIRIFAKEITRRLR